MRPSKLKKPLAVLRAMLTEPSARRDRKAPPVPLKAKTLAGWLDCSVWNVQTLETRASITLASAELIANQTGINVGWLMGKDTKKPIDWYGRPFTQATFDERQAELRKRQSNPKLRLHRVNVDFAKCCAFAGAILLRAFQTGKEEVAAQRLLGTLREFYFDVDKSGVDPNHLVSAWMRGRHTVTRPDLGPTLAAWEAAITPAQRLSKPRR